MKRKSNEYQKTIMRNECGFFILEAKEEAEERQE